MLVNTPLELIMGYSFHPLSCSRTHKQTPSSSPNLNQFRATFNPALVRFQNNIEVELLFLYNSLFKSRFDPVLVEFWSRFNPVMVLFWPIYIEQFW